MRVKTDKTGRITATSKDFPLGDGEFRFAFPEDFDFEHVADWLIVDGELVHDPLPEPEPEPSPLEALQAEINLLKAQNEALAEQNKMLEAGLCEVAEIVAAVAGGDA